MIIMKKILLAVMAIFMTMGVFAQCPQQQDGECKREHRECVYSPETRAMMRVDCIARAVKDLTNSERNQLVEFYRNHYVKCAERKASGDPMSKEECRTECNAALRKVLGDERYIKFWETRGVRPMDCGKCHVYGMPRRNKYSK